MASIDIRNPVRCFCSFLAKRTNDHIYVCGRYKTGGMVCLFHLHHENLDSYYQSDKFTMSLDCEMCLATLKIHSETYMAPCYITSIRCHCGHAASFYQSKKDNLNKNKYFFSCPNWKGESKCNFFVWAHEYQTIRDVQILRNLNSEGEIQFEKPRKRHVDEDLQQKINCVICFSNERSHLITPCNHLCCCSTCANQIQNGCPICRRPINSIQRIFFV